MITILIVEDDTSLSEIYKIRLEAEGYRVVTAEDGEKGLAVAVREKPDLILSDIMMPRVSGFDMLDILKKTPSMQSIKVVMMTALGGEDQRERGTELGADAYLVKSQVGIEDVVAKIKEVLDSDAPAAMPTASASTAPQVTTPLAETIPTPTPITEAAPIAPPVPTEPVVDTPPAAPATEVANDQAPKTAPEAQ